MLVDIGAEARSREHLAHETLSFMADSTISADSEASADRIIARFDERAARHEVKHLGRTVVWREFGSGPPLVLLHGGHGSWLHWIRNIDALSTDHTVWLPDMPGFGDSDSLDGHPHAEDRMSRFVDAVLRTMDALVGSATDLDLCGFSFGGMTAAALAAKRGHVRRLALVGPGGHGGARRQTIELVDWRVSDRGEMLSALRRNLVPFMLHDEHSADALALSIHEWSCVRTRFRSKPIAQAGRLGEALDGITAPMLLLWGEHDVTATPHEIAPQLTRGRSNRDFRIVSDAGHWAQYERPDEVNALLTRWFDAREPNGG